ncbi:MAG: hypothetical protein ACYC3I_01670 [Gemmataceae bacterium]
MASLHLESAPHFEKTWVLTMVAGSGNLLGVGLYTPEEASLYARVSRRMLRRWLYGAKASQPVIRPQLADEQEQELVTFLDLVQTMAVRAVRLTHRVSLQKIREAIDKAENEYGLPYPFARKHTTYLFGTEVIIKLGEDEYVQTTGKGARNRLITKVVELYIEDLGFNPEGLADAYRAFVWGDYEVKMNPHVRFGEPLVTSCGYGARALWEAVQAEGSFEAAAKAYGVKTEEVETACRYFDHILSAA